ncbi:MAG: GspH/FimT family pseudopilin [Gemmatimonadetes bacterium]|nr:GspH/FimT family pseudopilin [Gemmatimonadota bacterium]
MQHSRIAGFSLFEMLVAIGLIGILAAIAFPSFAAYTTPFRVQSAGREVYSALQDVRQQSITRGRRTRFQISGQDSYTLLWEDGNTWRTIRGPLKLDKDVRVVSSGGDLTFQPRGTVSPMTTLTISDSTNPEHRLVISVPITGLIRIREGGG